MLLHVLTVSITSLQSYLGLKSVVNLSGQNDRKQVRKETGQDRCEDNKFATVIGRQKLFIYFLEVDFIWCHQIGSSKGSQMSARTVENGVVDDFCYLKMSKESHSETFPFKQKQHSQISVNVMEKGIEKGTNNLKSVVFYF